MADKKIAIITGASSGIGLAAAEKFLLEDWNVLGVDITPAPESLTSKPNFSFLKIDITRSDAPSQAVAAARSAFGSPRIDAMLNVAGILDKHSGVDNLLDQDWDKLIAVNLTAPVKMMREVVNVMKANGGGSIVNVCSKAAVSGAVSGAAYTASKHALWGVTKNTAWLYKDHGIRCNATAPGATITNISQSSPPETWDMASYAKMKVLHDVHVDFTKGPAHFPESVQPATHAPVLFFLASDASRGITGTLVPIDNAWSTI